MTAGDRTNPQNRANLEVGNNLEPPTPEDLAALIEALGKIDLSKEFKATGMTFETALDGSLKLKYPEGMQGPSTDEILARGVVPPNEDQDSLPTNSANGENKMGLLDKYKICLCSELTAVITKDGQPVEGAEIIRRLDLFLPKDQVYTDRTVTDAAGRFAFKPAYAKRWKPLLAEVRTDQKILIRHDGKLYLGWSNIRSGLGPHEDVFVPGMQEGSYIQLEFYGDLSRATTLPDNVDLDRPMMDDGFFNSQVVCVCSRLHFFVTMNGEPAIGAKVVRTGEHVGYKSYEQSKVSDIDGEVNMDPVYASRLAHTWAKPEIKQKIVITYEGEDYLAWEKTKTNPWEQGEYNLDAKKGRMYAEITAELTDDPNIIRGVKTDLERCWKGEQGKDYLPPNAIPYKGLFQITRYSPNIQKDQ